VASDIEGYAAVADERSAVLVPPGDSAAIASALVELLTDEERRRALGEAALTVAERYSWDRIAGRLVEIYEELAIRPAAERAAA